MPVDPYGWTGTGADPYQREKNLPLWASGTSSTAEFPGAIWRPAAATNFETANRTADDIRWIVLHTTEGTSASAIQTFQTVTTPNGTSAHYLISRDGTVTQLVHEKDISYAAGNYFYNRQCINIEHERYGTFDWTEAQFAASVRLVQWLSQRYHVQIVFPGIPQGIAPADPTAGTGIIGHIQVPDPQNASLGGGANHHTDPVNWDWSHYAALFQAAVQRPRVSTGAVSTVTTGTAQVSASITSDGGAPVTERGVVFSLSNESPSVADFKVIITGGAGDFSANLTDLAPNSTYYTRAYAINSAGTAYADNVVSFVTFASETAVDVEPVDVSLSTTRVAPGASVPVAWQVRNNGTGTIDNATTRVWVSVSNAPGGHLGGSGSLGDFGAQFTGPITGGGGVSQNLTITAPMEPGTYYIWVVADGDGVLNQTSYTNDAKVSAAFVVTTEGLPSFILDPLSAFAFSGAPVIFTASAAGDPTPTYQWQRAPSGSSAWINLTDGGGVTGSQSAALTFADIVSDGEQFRCIASNTMGISTSATATLRIITTFDAWVSANFTPAERNDVAVSGASAVRGDGVSNLLKYALGLDPKRDATSHLPSILADAADWIFIYDRPASAGDVLYQVEVSSDLVHWSTTGVVHEKVASTDGTETWRGRVSRTNDALFFRLKVTLP